MEWEHIYVRVVTAKPEKDGELSETPRGISHPLCYYSSVRKYCVFSLLRMFVIFFFLYPFCPL
jgi:hypothetical protein